VRFQIKIFYMLTLTTSILLPSTIWSVNGEAAVKPSVGWGMFFDTTGNINISLTEPGVAVKVEVPRMFLEGVAAKSNRQKTNDTSFIESNISSDYYYYSVIDQSEYYPYDANAPYTIEVRNPPLYLRPDCSGKYYNYTPPKWILLKGLRSPRIAGVYNFTVYIALNVDSEGIPIYPTSPSKILQVHVSMREDPGFICGFIVDSTAKKYIKTKGVVYAVGVNSGVVGRGLVDPSTGFFNITGLYAGLYYLEGSAGYFQETGYAYAITRSTANYHLSKGGGLDIGNFTLNRGCIINGTITYTDWSGNPIKPLESPYLKVFNYKGLNYTVEVYDGSERRIVASRTYKSGNVQSEKYTLWLRNGTRYVGYPASGSEYAGFGPGTYKIRIWVYGFIQPSSQVKTVTFTGYGQTIDVGESRLPYGGCVSGSIRLRSGPSGAEETPLEGEAKSFGSTTGKHFGGNILVEMYRSDGVLKGLTVLNRTLPDGTVQYASYSSGDQTPLLRFHILGFSEFYNRSYSGSWSVGSYPGPSPHDYGVEAGTYYLRVWIRGYIQENIETFTVGDGGNTSTTVDLRRGGSVQVTVTSTVVKPGTRKPQMPTRWRFMDLCPPPRLRIYFQTSGVEVGYAETVLSQGSPGVENTSATLNFTGHNWSTEEIIMKGYTPNALKAGEYKVKAYTYGYIQAYDASVTIILSPFAPTHTRTAFPILQGCGVHGATSLTMGGVSVSLTEDVTIRTQTTLEGNFKGVDVVEAPEGSLGFRFNTYGIYGRGHFFYVDPEGTRWRDYGLDTGRYRINVQDFGWNRRFTQRIDIYVNLPELGWEVEAFFNIERMIKITGTVDGYDKSSLPVHLVWARAATDSYLAYTYDGDFAIHMPAGTYTLTFSCPGYIKESRTITTNDQADTGVVVLKQSGEPFP